MLNAKDVSAHQGLLGPAAFKGSVIVAIKCTELGPGLRFVDPQYQRNRQLARDAGAIVAPYAYGHPNTSAADSWDFFNANADLRPGDIPALDLEESDGLGPAEVASWGSAYAHTCYGSTAVWPLAYSDQAFILAGNFDGLRRCPWWVAILAEPVSGPPPLVDGHAILMQQWRIGGTGVPNDDVVYAPTSAALADYTVPGRARLARQAERELSLAERIVRRLAG